MNIKTIQTIKKVKNSRLHLKGFKTIWLGIIFPKNDSKHSDDGT